MSENLLNKKVCVELYNKDLRYSHFIQDHVKSTKFCEYLCAKVLPEWDSILSDDQNMLLRILAELCEHTEKFEQPKEAVANIHTVLMVRNVGNFRFLRWISNWRRLFAGIFATGLFNRWSSRHLQPREKPGVHQSGVSSLRFSHSGSNVILLNRQSRTLQRTPSKHYIHFEFSYDNSRI